MFIENVTVLRSTDTSQPEFVEFEPTDCCAVCG